MSCVGCRYSIHAPLAPLPLPRRSSAPKLSRIKMNCPNVRSLRSSHGAMQAKKIIEARTTPGSELFPRFARRDHAHKPAAGRNDSREVLFSAAIPQSAPNSSHGIQPSRSSRVSVSQKITASSSAERLVSQISRVHQNITFGSKAQAHAEPIATFLEKLRRAIWKMGMQVSAEQAELKVSSTNAEAFV